MEKEKHWGRWRKRLKEKEKYTDRWRKRSIGGDGERD
jgi:hypothetical protein